MSYMLAALGPVGLVIDQMRRRTEDDERRRRDAIDAGLRKSAELPKRYVPPTRPVDVDGNFGPAEQRVAQAKQNNLYEKMIGRNR